ncbi:unnamed protein product, partial [Urochloa humidicola]
AAGPDRGVLPLRLRRGGAVVSGAAAGPSLATSVYETHLGLVALSWSRAPLGLSLRAVLRLSPPSTPGAASSSSAASGAGYLDDDADANDEDETTLAFRVRPWLLWRRRGSRRFRAGGRLVDLAWDLSRARFPGSGSPEPSSGFFVAIVVDGEMVLAAGDLPDAAYRRTRARRPPGTQRPVLLSRREHVSLRDAGAGRGRSHTTWVTVQGKERQISVDLVARDGEEEHGGLGRLPRAVGAARLERDGQQRGAEEERASSAEARQGELVVVGVRGVLDGVVGQRLDGDGLGQPRGGRDAARRRVLAGDLRLEEL